MIDNKTAVDRVCEQSEKLLNMYIYVKETLDKYPKVLEDPEISKQYDMLKDRIDRLSEAIDIFKKQYIGENT